MLRRSGYELYLLAMELLLASRDLLEVLSFVAIILGIPAGIYQFYRRTRREQLDREYGTYNALDEKYLEFLQLCFHNSDLDIFDIPDSRPPEMTEEQKKRELIAFTVLISLLERAYLMYADQSTSVKRRQWTGWYEYMELYASRKNFQKAWAVAGDMFDTKFVNFMDRMIAKHTADQNA